MLQKEYWCYIKKGLKFRFLARWKFLNDILYRKDVNGYQQLLEQICWVLETEGMVKVHEI